MDLVTIWVSIKIHTDRPTLRFITSPFKATNEHVQDIMLFLDAEFRCQI